MHNPWQLALVALLVVLTIIITTVAAVYRSRERIRRSADSAVRLAERSRRRIFRSIDQMESRSARLRPVKNQWLDPVVDAMVRMGLTPDRQTYWRAGLFSLVLIWVGAYLLHHVVHLWLAALVFVPAALLDLTDGATARRYPELKTPKGKYLDPVVDTLFAGLFSLAFLPLYQHWIVPLVFFAMLVVRSLAFQRYRRIWSRRLKLGIFEKTEGGELKAGFVSVAFGFIMLSQVNPWFMLGSEFLLGLATIFEIQSLWALRKEFRRRVAEYRNRNVPSSRSTGTGPSA